jgi:hypothetical protein
VTRDESGRERLPPDVVVDRGPYAGRTIGELMQRERPAPLPDAVKRGSEGARQRWGAEQRIKNWIADFRLKHTGLAPSTQAFADEFARVYGPALDQLRSETGFKFRVGKAALRRIANGKPTHWGQSGRRPTEPDPRVAEAYVELALQKNRQFTFAECYRHARDVAEEHGLPMPSKQTMQTWFQRKYPKPVQIFFRQGKRRFEADCQPKIHRKYADLEPLEWVSLDGHVLNVMARVPDAHRGWRRCRPILTGIVDVRTRMFVGWDIRETENSDGILAGAKMMHRGWGCARHYYADNGEAYKHSIGARVRRAVLDDPRLGGLCAQTGAERHNALPKQGWVKIIESLWNRPGEEFEPYFRSYWGNKIESRPEDADKLRLDQLPTLDEVRAAWTEWLNYYHATPQSGDGMWDLSPNLVMEQFPGEVRKLDPDVLDFLCCRIVGPRRVGRDGIRLSNVIYGAFDEQVFKLQGRKVYLRLDPEQAEYVWVCDERGTPLCCAHSRNLSGATQEEVREAARIRARMRRVVQEYAPARDYLLDTDVQQIMRTKAARARAREQAVRQTLPAAAEPAVTIARPDLVGSVKRARANGVQAALKSASNSLPDCIPPAREALAALAAPAPGSAPAPSYASLAGLAAADEAAVETAAPSYRRFLEVAG